MTQTDANNNPVVGLALVAAPAITEQMQADSGLLWYQARDVAWTRSPSTEVYVYGLPLGLSTGNFNAPVLDRASGTLIYTRKAGSPALSVSNPLPNPVSAARDRTRQYGLCRPGAGPRSVQPAASLG